MTYSALTGVFQYIQRERTWKNIIFESVKKMLECILITSIFQFHHNYTKRNSVVIKKRESSGPA